MANNHIEDDSQETRQTEFFNRLGLPQDLYVFVVENSINHALSATPDPAAVPWRLWGARNIGGRIRTLTQHPRNFDVLYAGSAHGGVFETRNAGDTWNPLGAPEDAFPVGSIAVAPSQPDIMYVGSGEPVNIVGNGFVSQVTPAGAGLFRRNAAGGGFVRERKSLSAIVFGDPIDGAANSYSRIVVDPADADRCWVASSSGLWRREVVPPGSTVPPGIITYVPEAPTAGVAPGVLGSTVSDLVLVETGDPVRPYRLFAAVAGIGVHRGHFTPGGAGTTWDPRLHEGLPDPSTATDTKIRRIRLAVCRAQPSHVYAVYEKSDGSILGLFHSKNGGDKWEERSVPSRLIDPNDLKIAWWALALEVHPENPAILVLGMVNMILSRNFGRDWERILEWTNFYAGDRSQHADQHTVLYDLSNSHRLWITNDAGIAHATDVLQENPYSSRGWRRRSQGLQAGQFNDITLHPTFPFVMGGGLQDNGSYVGFGGQTWFKVDGGDGGQVAFEVQNPRQFISPWQGALDVSTVVSGTVAPGGFRMLVNADQLPPLDEFVTFASASDGSLGVGPLFLPLVEKHPQTAGHLIAGRIGDGAVSTNMGTSWVRMNIGLAATEQVSALAYGPDPVAASADWWVGTNTGYVWRGTNSGLPSTLWERKTPFALSPPASPPAPVYGAEVVSRILVHPSNRNYVLFATAGSGTRVQGRIFLSLDRGDNWVELTGIAAVAPIPPAPATPGPTPTTSLPPCPVTSLAFDPAAPPALAQTVFAGTIAGIYVIRNLPPATAAVMPAFHPFWNTFNGPAGSPPFGEGKLPLTLVKDLVSVQLPVNPAAAAGSPETVARSRLYAALFGRGIYACDITSPFVASPPYPAGGPPHRLFIRQHLIEDGLNYPRAAPAVLNTTPTAAAGYVVPELDGDPRFPAGAVLFTEVNAWDIRVDNAPFQFFDQVVDGVEFDEEMESKDLAAGERNIIYVQVQTAGFADAVNVNVHLFFAELPPASLLPATPLPDLQGDFWTTFTVMPLSPPGAPWARAAVAAPVTVRPNDPAVVRFDWLAPESLGGKTVGLLAVCENPADPIVPAAMPVILAQVVRNERRAAYRRVAVTRFTPDLYLRDSVEDDGTLGAVAFGGRSPDIIVVAAQSLVPATDFADLLDARAGDRLRAGPSQNFIYVRVHNRRDIDIPARVEVLFVKPVNPALAIFDPSNWAAVTAISPPASGEVVVPARGNALVEFAWNAAPPPDAPAGVMPALGLIALVQSAPPAIDPRPIITRVRDVRSFWQFFRALADSNNAALRIVLYE